MKVKKNVNFLEFVPKRNLNYKIDENGIVTVDVVNKGFYNFIAQKVFKRPRISHIKLDKLGSFIWTKTDGKTDIIKIGEYVKEEFKEQAEPIYQRLSKFYSILYDYKYVI